MSNTNWEWLSHFFSFLTTLAIMMLAMMPAVGQNSKLREFYLKKICWGILIISVSYFYITVPFFSSYYNVSNKLEYPTAVKSTEENEKYLKDHHFRIERLEDELKETKEELKKIQNHYEFAVHALFYAILYIGIFQIMKKRDGNLVGSPDNKTE